MAVSEALEQVGKWADSFLKATYPHDKPVPYGEMNRFNPHTIAGGIYYDETPGVHDKPVIGQHYDLLYQTPLLNNWFSDWLVSGNMNMQSSICGPLEIKALECIEYYGKQRGLVICKDWYDDWIECKHGKTQLARYDAIQRQYRMRLWKYYRGQLSQEEMDKNGGHIFHELPPAHGLKQPLKTRKNAPLHDDDY